MNFVKNRGYQPEIPFLSGLEGLGGNGRRAAISVAVVIVLAKGKGGQEPDFEVQGL